MSSLEKKLSNFKKELSSRNILTEDDLSELESHIIDKVDDLKQTGLNENDAFDEAINDLGSINEIAAEYSKVNFSPKMKFTLLCFGYFAINFMMSIIYLITIHFSYCIKNIPTIYDYKHIPVFTPILELLSQYNHSNYANLFIFIINTTLMLLLLYFAAKNNNNILSVLANKLLSIQSSKVFIKLIAFLLIVLTPILLEILTSFMFGQISINMAFTATQHNFNCLLMNITLIFLLISRYMKSKTPESSSSYMILGYLITAIAASLIPALVTNISIAIGQFNVACISILCIILFVITCSLIKIVSKKGLLERKPSIIYASLLVVCFICSVCISPFASSDYTTINDVMLKYSYMTYAVHFCINLLAALSLFSDYKFFFGRKRSIE